MRRAVWTATWVAVGTIALVRGSGAEAWHRSGDSAPVGHIRRSANEVVASFVGQLRQWTYHGLSAFQRGSLAPVRRLRSRWSHPSLG